MAALVEYEAHICECGLHESVADEDPDLEMPARFCPVCAGIAKNMRIVSAQDEKTVKALGKEPDPAADRPDDGRHFRLRPPESGASGGGGHPGLSEALEGR